jgi:hypothetical protein
VIDGPEVLIAEGESWRLHRGKEEPSPGLEWTEIGFDDSRWEQGVEPFGQPAAMGVATLLDNMNGAYTTIYLRRLFVVPDPGKIAGLILSVRVDDGFVAYLHGKEVARFRGGRKDTRLPSTALAEEKDGHDWTALDFPIDPGVLEMGENILALQGLNGEVESDFVLSPALRALPAAGAARLDELRPGLEAFERAAQGPDASARIAYLRGRVRELSGDASGARASYRQLIDLDPGGVEPRLRLSALLRAGGESGAVDLLREAIASGLASDHRLWDAWLDAHFVDLGSSPRDLRENLPIPPSRKLDTVGRRAADIRWLLWEIDQGRVLRLLASGKSHETPDGAVWSGDRFFQGGETNYLRALDERVPGPLYRTERYFPEGGIEIPAYRIPLPPGAYRVSLHFIEGWHKDDGRRREFDVLLEGREVIPAFDPGKVGFGVPQVKEFEMRVEDGALDIGFRRRIDFPSIAAVEIERLARAAETPQPSIDGGGGGRTQTSEPGLQPAQPVRSR